MYLKQHTFYEQTSLIRRTIRVCLHIAYHFSIKLFLKSIINYECISMLNFISMLGSKKPDTFSRYCFCFPSRFCFCSKWSTFNIYWKCENGKKMNDGIDWYFVKRTTSLLWLNLWVRDLLTFCVWVCFFSRFFWSIPAFYLYSIFNKLFFLNVFFCFVF